MGISKETQKEQVDRNSGKQKKKGKRSNGDGDINYKL